MLHSVSLWILVKVHLNNCQCQHSTEVNCRGNRLHIYCDHYLCSSGSVSVDCFLSEWLLEERQNSWFLLKSLCPSNTHTHTAAALQYYYVQVSTVIGCIGISLHLKGKKMHMLRIKFENVLSCVSINSVFSFCRRSMTQSFFEQAYIQTDHAAMFQTSQNCCGFPTHILRNNCAFWSLYSPCSCWSPPYSIQPVLNCCQLSFSL